LIQLFEERLEAVGGGNGNRVDAELLDPAEQQIERDAVDEARKYEVACIPGASPQRSR